VPCPEKSSPEGPAGLTLRQSGEADVAPTLTSCVAGIWHELSHYESRDGVTELYRRAHHREPNAAKAYAVVAAMSQGREFFQSARGADELVRPLLLFYGAVALSRGISLFRRSHGGEETLRPAHGLVARDWGSTLTAGTESIEERIRRLPDLRVGFAAGTFTELAMASCNIERTGGISGGRGGGQSWTFTAQGQTEFSDEHELKLRDVLARSPDLADTYSRTFDSRSMCYPVRAEYDSASRITTYDVMAQRYGGLPSESEVRVAFNLPPWVEVTTGNLGMLFGSRPCQTFSLVRA
jgi:YaaC-like Protein